MAPNELQSTKILIVDDEPTITDTLCTIFEHCGYDCTKAYDAERALELALETLPDLLLTDVMLPGMNGVQLAITLRERIPECKTLLLSGQAGLRKNCSTTPRQRDMSLRSLRSQCTRDLLITSNDFEPHHLVH